MRNILSRQYFRRDDHGDRVSFSIHSGVRVFHPGKTDLRIDDLELQLFCAKGTSTAGAGTFSAGTNSSVYTVAGYETGVRASVNNVDSARFTWTAPAATTGAVTLTLSGQQGSKSGSCTKLVLTSTEKVTSVGGSVRNPEDFALLQNFPNPFNPGTVIEYRVGANGSPNGEKVNITVTDLLGNEITTLVDSRKSAGTYRVYFNAEKLSAGVYFYTLRSGNFVQTRKLILIK